MNDAIESERAGRSRSTTEAELLRLIRERLHIEVVDAESELFETGLIDSLGFVDLLMILSQEFGVDVDVSDLDTDNFRTVRNIADYVVTHAPTTSGR